jgi:hypothetical protein
LHILLFWCLVWVQEMIVNEVHFSVHCS